MTEMAKTTISNRSRKLFTLSSIYQATRRLLNKKPGEEVKQSDATLAEEFWNNVAKYMPDWRDAADKKVAPSELRRDYIHAHGITLQALAIAGTALVSGYSKGWKSKLARLRKVDWSRDNAELWEGRALIGGRLSKAQNNVVLTANVLKKIFGLKLSASEQKVEDNYAKASKNTITPKKRRQTNKRRHRRTP
jgi:DNA sulfur modification protein DndB